MVPAIGLAAIGAMDLLSSVTSGGASLSKTSPLKLSKPSFNIADVKPTSGTATASQTSAASGSLSPPTFNALLSAQNTKPSDALKDLFGKIDSDGNGKITKAEFEDKLGAGGTNIQAADNVFNKIDTDGDGSVSSDELSSALKGKGGHHHAHRPAGGGGADAFAQALQGASSTSTTNSDGSITTTLTYADGTKVTMNQPATSTASSSASAKYNLVEQLVQRQANALSGAAKSSLSVSA